MEAAREKIKCAMKYKDRIIDDEDKFLSKDVFPYVSAIYKCISEKATNNTAFIVEDSLGERIALSKECVDYLYKNRGSYADTTQERFDTLVRHLMRNGIRKRNYDQTSRLELLSEVLEKADALAKREGIMI
jgi:hypothetical protein